MAKKEQDGASDRGDRAAWAEQVGRDAVQQAADAARTTWGALRLLAKDPPGQLSTVYSSLGHDKALRVGVSCIVAFVVAVVFASYGTLQEAVGQGLRTRPTAFPTVRFAVSLAAFPLGLWAGLTVIQLLVRKRPGSSANLFIAGVAVVPVAAALLAMSFLGTLNIELIFVILALASTEFILICNRGLRDLLGMSSAWALYGTAGVIVGALYLWKVALFALTT